MKLFDKEKDLVLRIVNLVFLVWIIVSLFLFYNGFVNIVFKKNIEPYSMYKESSCVLKDCDIEECDEEKEELICSNKYETYKISLKNDDLRYKKQMISSALSFVTVTFVMYILNKQKKVKK